MTGHENSDDREAQINALLDGELDEAATAALKSAAKDDGALAQAIVEAWQLQKSLDQLSLESAPASLSRKLKRIPHKRKPGEQKSAASQNQGGLPRWVLAAGLSSVMIVAIALFIRQPVQNPDITERQAQIKPDSDAQRLEKAQQELELAFYYLDRTGFRAGQQINEVLREGLSAPVKNHLSKHVPYIGHSQKEKQT